jgi:hypothetical protein
MRIQVTGVLTRPQSMRSLKPSWLQTLTLSSSLVVCFSFVMETTGSRPGHDSLRGCIALSGIGTTQWKVYALMQEAREAYFSMPCMTSTSESTFPFFE